MLAAAAAVKFITPTEHRAVVAAAVSAVRTRLAQQQAALTLAVAAVVPVVEVLWQRRVALELLL